MLTERNRFGLLSSPTRRSLLRLSVLSGLDCLPLTFNTLAAETRRTLVPGEEVNTHLVWSSLPKWNAGRLIWWDHPRPGGSSSVGIYILHNDGQRYERTSLALSDASTLNVYDAAVGRDAQIALVGSALRNDGTPMNFVAQIPPDRRGQQVTMVRPYKPAYVAIGPDGTFWTAGSMHTDSVEWQVLEHRLNAYDATGGLRVSRQIRLRKPNSLDVADLVVSQDRVGCMSGRGEYMEFLFDGTELIRYEGLSRRVRSGLAISGRNDVITFHRTTKSFVVLDRVTKQWVTATLPKEHQPAWAHVLGFEDDSVVMQHTNGIFRKLSLQ
jgi:hypothetical protein